MVTGFEFCLTGDSEGPCAVGFATVILSVAGVRALVTFCCIQNLQTSIIPN